MTARRPRLADRVCKAQSQLHGYGCFARVRLAAGDFIGTYEGDEVEVDGTYVLWVYDAVGGDVRARSGRNLLRWLNHSDDPNAVFDAFALYARRAILPGEEITIDYGSPEC